MAFSIYETSAPVYVRGLTNLSSLLAKAVASGVPQTELLAARLAPDMHPLPFQVQSACDTAKLAVARLTGGEAPVMADTESTFGELQDRITRTMGYIRGLDAAAFEGAEDREVVLKFPHGEMRLPGRAFLTGFALPNFYFHLTTAYAILRHKGVTIGKMDYLGAAS
jgi:hypothetical protein